MLDTAQKRKILFRASHRGTREMDIILGGYCTTHIDTMNAKQIAALVSILRIDDQTLYRLLSINNQDDFTTAMADFWQGSTETITITATALLAEIWLWMRVQHQQNEEKSA